MEHTISRVETTNARQEISYFVNKHHSYIKYADRPSRKLYWSLYENGKLVGVFGLGSTFKITPIMNYMNKYNIKFNEIANNIVYCLALNEHKNAGTIFLSLCRKDAIKWWHERYGNILKAFQTFILPPRKGTLYKADNWEFIGETKGKSIICRTIRKKDIKYYPGKIQTLVFKDGTTRYFTKEFVDGDIKLIYMKLNSKKYINKTLNFDIKKTTLLKLFK